MSSACWPGSGDDRALIYYGADHVREGRSAEDTAGGFSENTFVRRLIANDNGLSADDVYAIATVYPGTLRTHLGRSLRYGRRDDETGANLVRIFDVLRAEFPSRPNLGVDVDEARYALLALDRNTAYPLGEEFDGCLYFRDLNSWDGTTQPPASAVGHVRGQPPLTISSVIPSVAAPGNTIFIYGYVLSEDAEVAIVSHDQRFPCTDVRVINENVVSVRVPEPDGIPVSGQRASVAVRRRLPPDQQLIDEWQESRLSDAFRYRIG